MHEGHRQRMMDKMASDSMLQDHELLEILLFYAIPRKNTNEIAHNLIDACGSLAGVLHADVKRLESVEGVGKSTAVYLKTVGEVYARIGKSGLLETSRMIFSYHDFADYIAERYKNSDAEVLELYALDAKSRITFVQTFSSGDNDRVELSSADVSRFISDYGPKGIVIAHNHPGVSATPSAHDNDFTRLAHLLCSLNNVTLVDHVIVGCDRTYSYYLTGELEKIRECMDLDAMMRRARAQQT